MFENTENFNFDDDFLGTSFSSFATSTQQCSKPNVQADTASVKVQKENKGPEASDHNQVKKETMSVPPKIIIRHPSNQSLKRNNSLKSSPKVVKRKFPGPAGLLFDKTEIFESSSKDQCDAPIDDFFLCSQRTMSTFEDGPWKQMTKDFFVKGGTAVYERFNISWIKKQSSSMLFKAPFLVALIQSYDIIDGKVPTVNVTLQDPTGTIQGTILHSLYEEKADYLTVGSVIVLRWFGVLCSQNSFCLTITPNNLLTIYSLHTIKTGDVKESSTQKIVLQHYCLDSIVEEYNESVTKKHCDTKVNRISNVNVNTRIQANKSTLPIPSSTNHASGSISMMNPVSRGPANMSRIMPQSTVKKLRESNSNQSGIDKDVIVSCSQVSIKTDEEHKEIWKDLFEDVDAESLFDDF